MRFPRITLPLAYFVAFALPAFGQSPNGNINGLVLDPTNRVIARAEIIAVNDVTGVQVTTKSNDEGIYVLPNLPPGPYRLQVSKVGFKTIIKPDIILNVQDALSINFTLPVGALLETVTVEGGAPLINTADASASTVVDRKYVENIPLNGRSFQDLILLTPGVLPTSPQAGASIGYSGEFSVNGQRTESNYYSVDGVSANVGTISGGPSAASAAVSGSLPAGTALGTTQGLVAVDALQEFRVQSSSYSAEYGRNPGGQFSFVTRSGTNEWHGTAFDYLRNNVFDANDWFNDYFSQQQPPLRQNDFGGTLGGPVELPGLYDGRKKTFFFFSYEGLRVTQPQAASISYVPTAALRQSAPAALQPVLTAFPESNCPPAAPNCSNDLGNGLADFIGTWPNPSQVDSESIRLDHSINDKLKVFFRFSNASSSQATRLSGNSGNPANSYVTPSTTRTYTLGMTSLLTEGVDNDFRLNYSSNQTSSSLRVDPFGGGSGVNLAQLQGFTQPGAQVYVAMYFPGYSSQLFQGETSGVQKQWNFVDAVSISLGRHQLKFGGDYRRLAYSGVTPGLAFYMYFDEASVQANNPFIIGASYANSHPIYTNLSGFAQDEWHATPRLNVSAGLRWELNPAPAAPSGNLPYTVRGIADLSTMTLAPQGTPLWQTTWFNFAPRLGAVYMLRKTQGWETILRGGTGLFFDTGQQLGSSGYQGVGFSGQSLPTGAFPVPADQVTPPINNPPTRPYNAVFAFSPHLQLPYTIQWNVAVQQALGKSQAFTLSYIGSRAGRLLEENRLNPQPANPQFAPNSLFLIANGLTSDYNALQMQFQARINRGVQALASYTWSHCQDYGSYNASLPYRRGACDFDVRQNISWAFSFDLPSPIHNRFGGALFDRWGLDDRFTARTAVPVNLTSGLNVVDPATGKTYVGGLDVVQNQPVYIVGTQCGAIYGNGLACPGGRAINPNAFVQPPAGQLGNAPRNLVRGFGTWQMDVAVRREFPIYERLKLQFRAEAFNVFNHPNFGVINSTYCAAGPGCTFGQATATLAQSLGVLSPLYQQGGPRSMQFALKLIF
jgi:hypothetical protein